MMDIEQMRDEVQGIARDTSAERRRDRYNVALITTLLDVAESLRVLAAESAYAMRPQGFTVTEPDEHDSGVIIIGSVVYAEHIDGPGEVKSFGSTEDKMYALVDFGGEEVKVWLDALHLLTGDESDEPDPLAEVIIDKPAPVELDRIAAESDARNPEPDPLAEVIIEQDDPLATYAGVPSESDPETDFDVDPLEVVKRKAAARKKKGTEK